jgi:DNA-binding transcriptional LysR family regulator
MNLGVAFVPLMCVQEEASRGELKVVPVDGFRHERSLWVVTRRTDAHSHAAKAFMTVIGAISASLIEQQTTADRRRSLGAGGEEKGSAASDAVN